MQGENSKNTFPKKHPYLYYNYTRKTLCFYLEDDQKYKCLTTVGQNYD